MLPEKRRAGRKIRKQRRQFSETVMAFSALGNAAGRAAKQINHIFSKLGVNA